MSIRIDNITRGRFGNKLLQYNSLCQLANNYNITASCCEWEDSKFFKNILNYIKNKKEKKLLFCKKIIENEKLDFEKYDYIIDDPAYCLHNVFLQTTHIDPRKFLELKDEFKIKLNSDIIHIGIHIRGGDIIENDGNNGREIHEFLYYKKSIDYVLENLVKNKNYIFYICTDDKNFDSFSQTKKYLDVNGINYKLGLATENSSNHYIYDWSLLSDCDILINSSSTFCVTAGFLGKKNKYIIHSNDWIQKNINHLDWNNKINTNLLDYTIRDFRKTFDNFWINIKNNIFYSYNKLL
tara:strand:+ start:316 stop:1200 length:885 start_codon:yes stop_codon:yes gene_type:complete